MAAGKSSIPLTLHPYRPIRFTARGFVYLRTLRKSIESWLRDEEDSKYRKHLQLFKELFEYEAATIRDTKTEAKGRLEVKVLILTEPGY